MVSDIQSILITEEEIRLRIQQLGRELSEEYAHANLLVVCVLKGAFIFMADLVQAITVPIEVDFMAVSTYGSSTKSSGVVKIVKDLDIPVQGRDVLIVEDIIDSGLTLRYLMDLLQGRGCKSVRAITLCNKPAGRKVDLEAHYVGFSIPNDFVVGYGLDYAEKYRNLPYIAILKPEVYMKDNH